MTDKRIILDEPTLSQADEQKLREDASFAARKLGYRSLRVYLIAKMREIVVKAEKLGK